MTGISRKEDIDRSELFGLNSGIKYFMLFITPLFIVNLLFYSFLFPLNSSVYLSFQPDVNSKYTNLIFKNGRWSKAVSPDSSIVWLSSGTTLSYCDNFSKSSKVTTDESTFFPFKGKENCLLSVKCGGKLSMLETKFGLNSHAENGKISVVLKSKRAKLASNIIINFNCWMKNEDDKVAIKHINYTFPITRTILKNLESKAISKNFYLKT